MALAVEGDGRVSRRVLLEECPALPAEAITALHALGDDQGVEDVVAALRGADQACPDKHAHEVGATGNGHHIPMRRTSVAWIVNPSTRARAEYVLVVVEHQVVS